MGEEEGGLLPDLGDQLIEIIGSRRSLAGLDAHDGAALGSSPYSLLLMSSFSWFSFTFSMSRRSCSWIWS